MPLAAINRKASRFEKAARLEKHSSPDIIQKTHAVRHPIARAMISIFQVQSAVSAVDGVYICYKQSAGGGWGTVEYSVLNLIENNTVASYEPALAYHDLIAGWRMEDENETLRWVGIPLTPHVRRAKTTVPAGASTSITCNLFANDGETEITSGLGSGIEVFCKTTLGANLKDALPRLANDDEIFVENIAGKWWCVQTFQASENCICSS
ncbi:MAG: hypothetical protein ACE5HX_04410 [bacterium]